MGSIDLLIIQIFHITEITMKCLLESFISSLIEASVSLWITFTMGTSKSSKVIQSIYSQSGTDLVGMVVAALVQFCVLPKHFVQKVSRLASSAFFQICTDSYRQQFRHHYFII